MNKVDFRQVGRTIQGGLRKNAPEIAIGLGLVCFGTAIFSGIKETPKAIQLLDRKKEELGLEKEDKLPAVEAFKAVWKCYIPMGLAFTAGGMCILGAHRIEMRRNAALVTAVQITESAFREYKHKVIETIGENKEKAVRNEIVKDKVRANPPTQNQIIVTGAGKTRCYDSQTGRYFESDIETIRKKVNKLNYEMQSDHYISLNEFFWEIGLPHVDIGDRLGWNIEDGLIDVDFTSMLPEDGIPTLVLNYTISPRFEYRGY